METFLANAPFEKLTPYTLSSAEDLRAEIKRVRAQGYAIVDQELELGLRTVSVPVYDRHRHVSFALNVATHASKVSMKRAEEEFITLLQQVSREITAALP